MAKADGCWLSRRINAILIRVVVIVFVSYRMWRDDGIEGVVWRRHLWQQHGSVMARVAVWQQHRQSASMASVS